MWLELTDRGLKTILRIVDIPHLLKHYSSDLSCLGAPHNLGAWGKVPQLPPPVGTTGYKYSFFPRTVPKWNTLPSNIVSEPTLNKFKNSYFDI